MNSQVNEMTLEALIAFFAAKKGILYGLVTFFLKLVKDCREGRCNLWVALTDLIIFCTVGFMVYDWTLPYDIPEFARFFVVAGACLNSLFLVVLLTDKEIARLAVRRFLGIRPK